MTIPSGHAEGSVQPVIDLRSDTVTQPTPEMRRAIANAVVGDEQKREDPTVIALERRVAELLGHEDAVFVPTATMANQIALKLLSRPGDVLLAERHSHVLVYEYGGPAVHAGLVTVGVFGTAGRLTPEQIRAAVPERTKAADQAPSVLSLENTHNNAGGRVWPLTELTRVIATGRELGLGIHLDGARLLNAAVALGCDPREIASAADTATICLSKGLGCPLGALLAGSEGLIGRARREKHLFGGAMRQAGIVAAAGLYALDHHVRRLETDHARARRLALGLHSAGLAVDLEQVETNFVQIDLADLGLPRSEALARLREAGVGLSATIHETVIRAVTHLDVSDEDIERAVELIPDALGARVGVQPRSPAA
jgi:threonine aldolase